MSKSDKHGECVLKLGIRKNVEIWKYEVNPDNVDGTRFSYEVFIDDDLVGRFLYIDIGEDNYDIAEAYASGCARTISLFEKRGMVVS